MALITKFPKLTQDAPDAIVTPATPASRQQVPCTPGAHVCLPVSRPLNPLTSAARENTFDQVLRSGKGMVILNEQSSVLQFSESPALFSQRSLVLGPWSSLVRVLGLHRVHVPCDIYHPSPWQVLAIYSFCRQEVY